MPDSLAPQDVLKLELIRSKCEIRAADPSMETLGVIEAIRSFLAGRRRMPPWLSPIFRATQTTPDGTGSVEGVPFALLPFAGAVIVGIIAVVSISDRHHHGAKAPTFEWPSSLVIAVAMASVIATVVLGFCMARTVLFSDTRGQAPTWLMRNRTALVITIVSSAVSLWVGHIWH